jgi:hypothetical protein
MRNLIVLIWLGLLFIGISALFWYNDWKYKLPTPVPPSYKAVSTGITIELPQQLNAGKYKPVFLHFFNPDCPCSRFNMIYFKSLVKQYQEEVSFVIVVMNNTRYSVKEIQHKFGLDLPVSFDTALATSCGVYSTPQAVILNRDNQLYYRGNYNKSRYCTDKKTNYAEIALNALLKQGPTVFFDQYALRAYGCQLPQCTK